MLFWRLIFKIRAVPRRKAIQDPSESWVRCEPQISSIPGSSRSTVLGLPWDKMGLLPQPKGLRCGEESVPRDGWLSQPQPLVAGLRGDVGGCIFWSQRCQGLGSVRGPPEKAEGHAPRKKGAAIPSTSSRRHSSFRRQRMWF